MSYEFGQTVPHGTAPQTTDMLIALLLGQMADELDHPEVWRAVPDCIARFPDFRAQITARFHAHDGRQEHLLILHAHRAGRDRAAGGDGLAVCVGAGGGVSFAIAGRPRKPARGYPAETSKLTFKRK